MNECRGPECSRPPTGGKGLCQTHYSQHRKGKELTPIRKQSRTKSDEDYMREYNERQEAIRNKQRSVTGKCIADGCDRDAEIGTGGNGLCRGHYQQKWTGREFAPLMEKKMRDLDSPIVHCNVCDRDKEKEDFYLRKNGLPLASCKYCSVKLNRASRLDREGRHEEAAAVREVLARYIRGEISE